MVSSELSDTSVVNENFNGLLLQIILFFIVQMSGRLLGYMICGHMRDDSISACVELDSLSRHFLSLASDWCLIKYIYSYFICNSNFIINCKWICVGFLPFPLLILIPMSSGVAQ